MNSQLLMELVPNAPYIRVVYKLAIQEFAKKTVNF